MAVAGDRLVLTDPLDASLRVVDLERFAEADRIAMDGMPYNVVAIGGSGLTH
jgi:zinc transport system substrate-binding protein